MEDTLVKPKFYAYMLRIDINHDDAIPTFMKWKEKYRCAYWILGLEFGSETGKPHIQGIVWFESLQKKDKLRNWFRNKVDCRKQAVAFTSAKKITNLSKYCMKDGNYVTNLTASEIELIGKWNVGDGSDYSFMKELYTEADRLCKVRDLDNCLYSQCEFIVKLLEFYLLKGKRPSKSTMDYLLFKYGYISPTSWYNIHYCGNNNSFF